tara:strand:- start:75 stop:839 length:765 start_codon:yes stop_codon:yes gene_type:complete
MVSNIENVNTRKSYLTALVGILDHVNNPTYNKINKFFKSNLNAFKSEVLNKIDQNEKTETQKANWIDWTSVIEKQKELATLAAEVTQEEVDNNNQAQIEKLENFAILSLYTVLPPRRNVDFFLMKIGEMPDGAIQNNWYDGISFTFNVYKTARSRGAEKVAVPHVLRDILDDYILKLKLKPNDYLLFPNMKNRSGSVKMTRTLNSIFGKNFSSSMLRHSWNTHILGDMLSMLKKNANDLGHSIGTDINYIKLDS